MSSFIWRAAAGLLVLVVVVCSPFNGIESGLLTGNPVPHEPVPPPNQRSVNDPRPGEQRPAVDREIPRRDTPEQEQTPAPPSPSWAAENTAPAVLQPVKRVEVEGMVGLSFDDGPCPGMTELYVEILKTHDIRATFFMVGKLVSQYPQLARQVVEQGSEIGSHSWRHGRLDLMEQAELAEDLKSVIREVYDIAGMEVSLLRPPYGRHSEAVLAAAHELNQRVILWDVDPRDWEDPTPEQITARVMEQVKPGSIIILHEGHANTLVALPGLIQKLRAQGLEPVPVSELF